MPIDPKSAKHLVDDTFITIDRTRVAAVETWASSGTGTWI